MITGLQRFEHFEIIECSILASGRGADHLISGGLQIIPDVHQRPRSTFHAPFNSLSHRCQTESAHAAARLASARSTRFLLEVAASGNPRAEQHDTSNDLLMGPSSLDCLPDLGYGP
jgi:hypothetical protein